MLPLGGITVVTLEHAVAAPFATRQLADIGAQVLKIERPGVSGSTTRRSSRTSATRMSRRRHQGGWRDVGEGGIMSGDDHNATRGGQMVWRSLLSVPGSNLRMGNGDQALLRDLREHHGVVLRGHRHGPRRQVWLVAPASVLDLERRAV